ncbi:MAG TPA: ABC transporter permease [Gemmata sp.]
MTEIRSRLFARKPFLAAVIGFAYGGATALLSVWVLGTPRTIERVVEVEKVVEKPVEPPAGPRCVDLVVVRNNKPLGLDSDFGEYFVEQTRNLSGALRVSEAVVGVTHELRGDGSVSATPAIVQGWRPDNFGFEDMVVLSGRMLTAGDTHKVMLGQKRASGMGKKVGDTVTFVADPEHPYKVIGVYKSPVVFEDGGAIVSFADGQALTGKRVTGFVVRVKGGSPDVLTVKRAIEALRDPRDPTVRLEAEPSAPR